MPNRRESIKIKVNWIETNEIESNKSEIKQMEPNIIIKTTHYQIEIRQ